MPSAVRIIKLIADLDSADAQARDRATAALRGAGEPISKQLRAALDGDLSPEVRSRLMAVVHDIEARDTAIDAASADARRAQRLVEVLSRIGTPAALERLIALSGDVADPKTAQNARAALRRL